MHRIKIVNDDLRVVNNRVFIDDRPLEGCTGFVVDCSDIDGTNRVTFTLLAHLDIDMIAVTGQPNRRPNIKLPVKHMSHRPTAVLLA